LSVFKISWKRSLSLNVLLMSKTRGKRKVARNPITTSNFWQKKIEQWFSRVIIFEVPYIYILDKKHNMIFIKFDAQNNSAWTLLIYILRSDAFLLSRIRVEKSFKKKFFLKLLSVVR
jgi:hypothetical protein